MNYPWHAAWLSPFRAMQAVVADRGGDLIAEAIDDYGAISSLYRRSLDVPVGLVLGSFARAEKDLQYWCMQGLIRGRGSRIVGPFGQLTDPENLEEYWSDTRSLNFERSTLGGNPTFMHVTLKASDIRQQLVPTEPILAEHSDPSPAKLLAKWQPIFPPIRKGAKSTLAAKSLLELYPNEKPGDHVPIQTIYDAVVKHIGKDLQPPAQDTVARVLGRLPWKGGEAQKQEEH